MSTKLRTHGKGAVVWILLGVLVLGLGGFGISNFSGGMRTIGSVGGTEVTSQDYARALRQQLNQIQQQTGRAVTMEQAKAFGLPQQVQAQLFSDAALSEAARRLGLSVGDAELARQITAAPAFQSPAGGFDRNAYRMALRQEGFTEPDFEAMVRADIARSLFRGILVGGTSAPEAEVDTYAAYVTDKRPFAFAEIAEAQLTTKPAQPTDADLQSFYTDHQDAYQQPETRDFSYVWLTPEMLADEAAPDDAMLHAAYQARLAQYQQPEHRLVDRLVFESDDAARAAKADLDAGKITFTALAKSRGLDLKDIDLGEVGRDDLGAAADAVFAPTAPGVVGPVETDLGPALFSVNGIIPAQTTSFEDAKPDLVAAATLENAAKTIKAMTPDLEDKLASGATLDDLAKDTKMQAGTIAMTADTKEGIAAYPAFRDAAAKATTSDFPELVTLDDGGVFALHLDKVEPAAVLPFDKVRERVAADWAAAELTRLKTERAKAVVAAVAAGKSLADQGLAVTEVPATERGGFVENVPAALIGAAFDVAPGSADTVATDGKVYVLVPGPTEAADPKDPDAAQIRDKLAARLGQAIANDIGTYYAATVEQEAGVRLDSTAVTAVQAQMH